MSSGQGFCQFQIERGHDQLWGALEKIRECCLERVTLGDLDIASVCVCVCGPLWAERTQQRRGGGSGQGASEQRGSSALASARTPDLPHHPQCCHSVAALPTQLGVLCGQANLCHSVACAPGLSKLSALFPIFMSLLELLPLSRCPSCLLFLVRATHPWGRSPVPGRLSWPLQSWSPLPWIWAKPGSWRPFLLGPVVNDQFPWVTSTPP